MGTNGNQTIILSTDFSDHAEHAILPLVPTVAIHYRCGDNFVGHYGFLPFRVISSIINEYQESHSGNGTIFVLAEKRDRKTIGKKKHHASLCDRIFSALYVHLKSAHPNFSVVIRRGDDMFTDMYRLVHAPLLICSVSTFCLWPAISNQ